MVSFSTLDIIIITGFFFIILFIGFWTARKKSKSPDDYLLSGRSVGLSLFILTNVATWYGGILGVGEFTYRYGLVSWFTQGFPYYLFALIFALLFAKKIRKVSLFTIPDKLESAYGKSVGLIASFLIFILVSPAPYLLMIGSLISLVFGINIFWSLLIGIFVSTAYLIKGGYRSNIFTDAFSFFVMFAGFIIALIVAYKTFGGVNYLADKLPESYLKITGNAPPLFIIVWFLIALWTFTDPGFHQRCYSAESGSVAVKGIIISVLFWALFDFLTTSLGLYARAVLPGLNNPVLSFPLIAEKILGPGLKGIFYSALFATILSTLNSFMFLGATTFGRDFIFRIKKFNDLDKINIYTKWGIGVTAFISFILAFNFNSVIDMWYTIGSLCIPGIILLIISSYYERLKISNSIAIVELILSTLASIIWFIIRPHLNSRSVLSEIEPMAAGLVIAIIIYLYGFVKKKRVLY